MSGYETRTFGAEATALPIEPQPLPKDKLFISRIQFGSGDATYIDAFCSLKCFYLPCFNNVIAAI